MNWKDRVKLLVRKSNVTTPIPDKLNYQVWGEGGKVSKIQIPKIIWIYWHDEVINSPITNICIDQIRKLHLTYQINLVHWNSLRLFLPDFPNLNLDNIKLAQLSDLVRLMLLERYGGVYLDASTFLTKSIDWIINLCGSERSSFAAYFTNENTTDSKFPTIENWCLISCPNHAFISDWLGEYRCAIESGDPDTFYATSNLLSKSESIMGYAYYTCYYSAQLLIRRSQDYKLLLLEADNDAFLYSLNIKNKWSDIYMADIMLINKQPVLKPNMIKLISSARKTIDIYISQGYYKKDSIIGAYIFNNNILV